MSEKVTVEYDPKTERVRVVPRPKLTVAWAPPVVICAGAVVGAVNVIGGLVIMAVERSLPQAIWTGALTVPAFVALASYAVAGAVRLADEKERKARELADKGNNHD